MPRQSMQFLFGDRELRISVSDLLTARVAVIVNSANPALTHDDGLSATILAAAGETLREQSAQLLREYGQIDSGMALYTSAGQLPFAAVIHAVGPQAGEEDGQRTIEQAVSRSLLLCEANAWNSIAFPALGSGRGGVSIETCARAFHRAITHFWDARSDCMVETIRLCLTGEQFRPFFAAFREEATVPQEPDRVPDAPAGFVTGGGEPTGEIELSEAEIADLESEDMADWFK